MYHNARSVPALRLEVSRRDQVSSSQTTGVGANARCVLLCELAAALLLSAIPPGCAPPEEHQPIETSVSGRVFDGATRAGIASAVVHTEPPSQQVTTNDDGYYRLTTDVNVGETYTIFANADGYEQNKATVAVREGENTAVDISLGTAGPVLEVEPSDIRLGGRQDSRPLVLRNRGAGALNYRVSVSGGDWLSIENETEGTFTTTAVTLNVRGNRTGLPEGEYSGQLVVTSNGGDATVVVSMEVLGANEPRLSVNPTRFDFGADQSQAILAIENFGTGTLTWQIVGLPHWLTANPPDGDTTGEVDQVSLIVARDRLDPGDHTVDVTVRSNHIDAQIPVSVSVAGGSSGPGPQPQHFAEGEIVDSFLAPGGSACGLAVDGATMWIGDCGETMVRRRAADGSIVAEHRLPTQGDILDLALAPQGLFVLVDSGQSHHVWRLDTLDGTFVDSEVASNHIVGIAYDGVHVCTWQGTSIYRRDPETLDVEVRAIASSTEGPFTYSSGQFFTLGEVSMDGIYFRVEVKTFNAENQASVRQIASFQVPVDASLPGWVTAQNEYLWILGRGVGEDGGRVVKIRLR